MPKIRGRYPSRFQVSQARHRSWHLWMDPSPPSSRPSLPLGPQGHLHSHRPHTTRGSPQDNNSCAPLGLHLSESVMAASDRLQWARSSTNWPAKQSCVIPFVQTGFCPSSWCGDHRRSGTGHQGDSARSGGLPRSLLHSPHLPGLHQRFQHSLSLRYCPGSPLACFHALPRLQMGLQPVLSFDTCWRPVDALSSSGSPPG